MMEGFICKGARNGLFSTRAQLEQLEQRLGLCCVQGSVQLCAVCQLTEI